MQLVLSGGSRGGFLVPPAVFHRRCCSSRRACPGWAHEWAAAPSSAVRCNPSGALSPSGLAWPGLRAVGSSKRRPPCRSCISLQRDE